MADSELVNVLDSRYELLKVFARGLLFKALILHDQIEELASFDKFHDEVEVLLRLDDFVDLDHVGVMQLLEDLDFTANSLDVLLVLDARLLQYLDGHLQIQKWELTFSPVRMCVPCFTLPKVPSPSALPST